MTLSICSVFIEPLLLLTEPFSQLLELSFELPL